MIAVFLALGLGILIGSVVLSDRYVDRLENRVQSIEGQLDERREDILDLTESLETLQDFSAQAQERLLDGALLGEEVVILELPRTDGSLRDAVTEAIEGADGSVASTIMLTERFALDDETAAGELAEILQSSSEERAELRLEAAEAVGLRAAMAAARLEPERGSPATQRLVALVDALREADFLDVAGEDEELVPAGAAFVVLGGAPEDPTPGTMPLSLDLARALAGRGAAVLVSETSGSSWSLVGRIRDDADAGAVVSTVDAGDSVPGRIAVALGLDLTIDGVTGHYGAGDGATAIVPPPTPDA